MHLYAKESRTRESWEKAKKRKEFERKLQRGEISYKDWSKLVADGVMTYKQIEKMYTMQRQGILGRGDVIMFQRMPAEDQEYLINKMTDKEKQFYIQYAKDKVKNRKLLYR